MSGGSGQCGLCLSCGAPFLPVGEDMVSYDRLGNISVFYFQKLVRNNHVMQQSIRNPTFCAKGHQSHVLHKTHHKHAVELQVRKSEPIRRDGFFPFIRNPTGKTPTLLLAFCDPPEDNECIYFTKLDRLISSFEDDVNFSIDYNRMVYCCSDCNFTMTMEFWFRYHLYVGSENNPACVIPDESIEVYNASKSRLARIDDYESWTRGRQEGDYPTAIYSKSKDIMSAAIYYYLEYCTPTNLKTLEKGAKQQELFLHMSWVILEVTCLLCEYWRGSQDSEHREGRTLKRNQCHKSALGAAELYFSYFCWSILCFQYTALRNLSFENWHQLYMWDVANCKSLFPRDEWDASGRLLADLLTPDGMSAPSKQLITDVGQNMTRLLKKKISKLGRHLAGVEQLVAIQSYFVPLKYVRSLDRLMQRGAMPDFDSFAAQVGIDAMMFRVIDLSRDFDNEVRKKLISFRSAWRRAEVQNIARLSGSRGTSLGAAAVVYRLCKLLNQPRLDEWAAMSAVEARLTLLGQQCSPWAAVLALHETGAFDTSTREEAST